MDWLIKIMHKKTAYDGNRKQLEKRILENILLANTNRKGGN